MTESAPTPGNRCECDPPGPGECTICGDAAWQAVVLEVGPDRIATIEVDGGRRQIVIDLLDNVSPGDTILVQFGFAIARVEPS